MEHLGPMGPTVYPVGPDLGDPAVHRRCITTKGDNMKQLILIMILVGTICLPCHADLCLEHGKVPNCKQQTDLALARAKNISRKDIPYTDHKYSRAVLLASYDKNCSILYMASKLLIGDNDADYNENEPNNCNRMVYSNYLDKCHKYGLPYMTCSSLWDWAFDRIEGLKMVVLEYEWNDRYNRELQSVKAGREW